MKNSQLVSLMVAVGGLLLLSTRGVAVPGGNLSARTVADRVKDIVGDYFPGRVDPEMVLTIASVESSLNPTATRFEASIGEFSVGLMQTLIPTARWLHEIGYTAFPEPDFASLLDPDTSIYFGAAYLDYLSFKNGITKGGPVEQIVRAYNGGAGNASAPSTVRYWEKYQQARAALV